MAELEFDSENDSDDLESESDGSNYSPAYSDIPYYPTQRQISPTTSHIGQSSLFSGPVADTTLPLRSCCRNQPYLK